MSSFSPRLTWLLAFVVAIALVSTLVYRGSYAAFSASTSNGPNTWTAGSIALTDDDSGQAMFTVSNLLPGATGEKCIRVTYTGASPPTAVRLYAAVGETDGGTDGALLADHLNITVTHDSDAGSFASCAGFTPDGTIVNDVLADIGADHTNFSNGLKLSGVGDADWTPANGGARTFKFTYTLSSSAPNTVQGDGATATFTWEAQTS